MTTWIRNILGGLLTAVLTLSAAAVEDGRNLTRIEALVVQVSKLPEPQSAPYPDCDYTVELEVKNVLDGPPVPRRINLVLPGFRDYKPVAMPVPKVKAKLVLQVEPYGELPQEAQAVMIADDLLLYDLEEYFGHEALPISEFQQRPVNRFKDGEPYRSLFEEPLNPGLPDEAVADRQRWITSEFERIKKILEQYDANRVKTINDQFTAAWQQRQGDFLPEDGQTFSLQQGVSYFRLPEKYALLPRLNLTAYETNIENLAAFNRILKFHNIQLIVVLVPNMYDVSARIMMPEFKDHPDLVQLDLAYELLKRDIETVVSTDAVTAAALNYPYMFFYFDNNKHPAFGAQDVMTDLALERLRRFTLPDDEFRLQAEDFSLEERPTIYGEKCRYPESYEFPGDDRTVTAPYVLYRNELINFNPDSPVAVLGNSFSQTPMTQGAFPALLARKMNYNIAYFFQSSSGAFDILLKNKVFDRSMLKNKQVLVTVFPADFMSFWTVNCESLDRMFDIVSNSEDIGELKPENAGELNNFVEDYFRTVINNLFRGQDHTAFTLDAMTPQRLDLRLPEGVGDDDELYLSTELFANTMLLLEYGDNQYQRMPRILSPILQETLLPWPKGEKVFPITVLPQNQGVFAARFKLLRKTAR